MRGVNCGGWWFAAMNLFVHSVMYTYYGITQTGLREYIKKIDFIITILQISQMFFGCYFLYQGTLCADFKVDHTFWIPFCMYASYFMLFVKLFGERYLWGGVSAHKKTKKE